MRYNKRGKISGLVGVLLVIVVVLIAWLIVSDSIYTLFGGLINWTRQITGLETEEDTAILEREKQVKKELEQLEKEKREKAKVFFNELMSNYESCLSEKSYSEDKNPTLTGACNCGIKIDPKPLSDYAIDFSFDSTQGITTFKLKATETTILDQRSLNQLFKPCKFDSLISKQFSPNCQTKEILYEDLKIHTINNELMLAKAKAINTLTGDETDQGIVFFSDTRLPLCT